MSLTLKNKFREKCEECFHLDFLNINHELNIIYKHDNEISQILINHFNIPYEITIKIINMTHTYNRCSQCPTTLCKDHYDRAINNGNYYRMCVPMCDSCCWNHI